MNRKQKIAFLALNKINVAADATDVWIDAEISKFENRTVNFQKGGGKINVIFDKAGDTPVEVMIYGDIGDDPFNGTSGFTAQNFLDAIKDIPQNRPLDIRINSAGGDVRDGLAIKTRLDEWKGKKTASIDGMAASVASWLPMAVDEIRAPKHAQMFIHDAWGLCLGNPEEMRGQADELDKTSDQIADIYATKTGRPRSEMRDLMKKGTLFTAEEANKMGLIDRLTDDEPVSNFSETQIRNIRSRLTILNSLKTAKSGQQTNTKIEMNRQQKIALLNKWGVSVSKGATDDFVNKMYDGIKSTLPQNAVKYKSGDAGEHAGDCSCSDCSMSKNAPEPDVEEPDADAGDGAPGTEGTMFTAATANKQLKAFETRMNKLRTGELQKQFDKFVEVGRMGANEVKDWLKEAVDATDGDDGTNPVVNRLDKVLPKAVEIGTAPLNIEVGEPTDAAGLDKAVEHLMKQSNYYSRNARNGTKPESLHDRMMVGQNSKQVARLINKLKKYDKDGHLTGPIRDMWDRFEMSPRNANVMSAQLLRQVILSEVMRAFRRAFTPLTYFAHNFGNIPLEGTDHVEVPYYPLATTASTEFTYANGYLVNTNGQTLSKDIFVGGQGTGVATPGSGRKYQALQFTAYEIRRQPWLDIQKLSVMAGEQLALDVRADIIGTQICAANFGNAIWTGGPGGFDHTVIGGVLMLAANNAFWPKRGRNVVVGTSYHANATLDPAFYAYLYAGPSGADVLEDGNIKNKYRFDNITEDAILPIPNYIQGGSGNLVAGLDPYLAGYMSWPSAVLIATAPIMPPPGVLKKLVAYEQITDDQTNLAFTYQFWGDESHNRDNEIIECTYGSGLGELKALFRLTSQGV